ncbi:VNG_1110C family protein [Halorussus halophilus]|uniref:VNG_1110C family protein n=1 Tax=Halorussus halophilus TaxID=2650975 RepID=UPI001300D2D5|nr:hypothetical protein [Halorussus halophilus]
MPGPSTFRDSTQIVLPADELEGLEAELQAQFTVSIFKPAEDWARIIGSPVEIEEATEFLSRHGVSLP